MKAYGAMCAGGAEESGSGCRGIMMKVGRAALWVVEKRVDVIAELMDYPNGTLELLGGLKFYGKEVEQGCVGMDDGGLVSVGER